MESMRARRTLAREWYIEALQGAKALISGLSWAIDKSTLKRANLTPDELAVRLKGVPIIDLNREYRVRNATVIKLKRSFQ